MTPRLTSFFTPLGHNHCDYSNALRRHNANCFAVEIRLDKPLDKSKNAVEVKRRASAPARRFADANDPIFVPPRWHANIAAPPRTDRRARRSESAATQSSTGSPAPRAT